MKFYISLPMSGHTGDDIEQRIGMAKVVVEKYVRQIQEKDLKDAGGYTRSVAARLQGFDASSDIYDPVSLNDGLYLSDDASDNGYDNPTSVIALGEDIKSIISAVDVLVLCDGWENSKGCVLEMMAALLFEKRIIQLIDGAIVCPKGREVIDALMSGINIVEKAARVSRAMPFGLYNFK